MPAEVVVVPFLGHGRVVPGLVTIATSPAEHWVLTASRALRERIGGSVRELHPFALEDDRIAAWAEVVPEAVVEAVAAEAAGGLAVLAARARARLTDADWFRDTAVLLEQHYLVASDVYGGSGKFGGAASWDEARRFTVGALHRGGTFLDLGCANGLLMESMVEWASADRGLALEPYGVDISPALTALARRRLPRWADRIWTGNGWDWEPPRRFDFVHTLPELVPEHLRGRWLRRLASDFLEPDGRLIVRYGDPYPHDPDRRTLARVLADAGVTADGELVRERPGRPAVRVAWIGGG